MHSKQWSPGKGTDRNDQRKSEPGTTRIVTCTVEEQLQSKKKVYVVTRLKWEEEALGLNMDSQLVSALDKFICSPNNPCPFKILLVLPPSLFSGKPGPVHFLHLQPSPSILLRSQP